MTSLTTIKEELLILTKTYPAPSTRTGRLLALPRSTSKVSCVGCSRSVPSARRRRAVQEMGVDYRSPYDPRTRTTDRKADASTPTRLSDPRESSRPNKVIGARDSDGSNRTSYRRSPPWRRAPSHQETLGFLRVSRILELKITPVKQTDWTEVRQNQTDPGRPV